MCDKEATAGIHNDIYEKQLEGGLYEMLQRHYQYIYKKSFNWINLKKKKETKRLIRYMTTQDFVLSVFTVSGLNTLVLVT